MTKKFSWLTGLFFSGSMLLLLGCGPITSATAIKEAKVAIAEADSAGAVNGAPYEYYSAVERLKKAREEQGYSDFQAAVDLAVEAKRLAIVAKKRLRRRRPIAADRPSAS